jgi:hypothetical protein
VIWDRGRHTGCAQPTAGDAEGWGGRWPPKATGGSPSDHTTPVPTTLSRQSVHGMSSKRLEDVGAGDQVRGLGDL